MRRQFNLAFFKRLLIDDEYTSRASWPSPSTRFSATSCAGPRPSGPTKHAGSRRGGPTAARRQVEAHRTSSAHKSLTGPRGRRLAHDP